MNDTGTYSFYTEDLAGWKFNNGGTSATIYLEENVKAGGKVYSDGGAYFQYGSSAYQFSAHEQSYGISASANGTYESDSIWKWTLTAAPWVVVVKEKEYINAVGEVRTTQHNTTTFF